MEKFATAAAAAGGRLVSSDIFSSAFELRSASGGLLRLGLDPLFQGPSLHILLGTLRGNPRGATWGGIPTPGGRPPLPWWWWWWWWWETFLLDKSSGNGESEIAAEVRAFTTAAAATAAGSGNVGEGDAAIAFWLKSRTLVTLFAGGLQKYVF